MNGAIAEHVSRARGRPSRAAGRVLLQAIFNPRARLEILSLRTGGVHVLQRHRAAALNSVLEPGNICNVVTPGRRALARTSDLAARSHARDRCRLRSRRFHCRLRHRRGAGLELEPMSMRIDDARRDPAGRQRRSRGFLGGLRHDRLPRSFHRESTPNHCRWAARSPSALSP